MANVGFRDLPSGYRCTRCGCPPKSIIKTQTRIGYSGLIPGRVLCGNCKTSSLIFYPKTTGETNNSETD